MRVAAWRAPEDLDGAPARMAGLAAAARRAAAAGAKLLVTPELALDGPGGIAQPGSPSDGPQARALAALAREAGIAIAAGYLEACSGRRYSAALLVEADGRAVANYRRTHRRAAEAGTLARGAWLSVMPLAGRRCGLLIGYDLLFPEPARALVLAGADLLLVLGAPAGEPARQVTALAAARAIENGVPLVLAPWASPRAAPALILGPDGESLARAEEGPGVIVATLPAATGPAPVLADRRPGLYHQLVADEVPAPGDPRRGREQR